MAKYEVKDIERAKRSVLQEMFVEFGLTFDESLKNDELRAILYKANEEWVDEQPSEVSEETLSETLSETSEENEEQPVTNPVVSSVIAQRRMKAAKHQESQAPTVSMAIRDRRAIGGSVSDAIRQRRLGKK